MSLTFGELTGLSGDVVDEQSGVFIDPVIQRLSDKLLITADDYRYSVVSGPDGPNHDHIAVYGQTK